MNPIDRNTELKYTEIRDVKEAYVHGRTCDANKFIPLFWNNSGIEVCNDGSELWIDVEVDYSVFEPWYAIEINGALVSRAMLQPGRSNICLFRNMSKGVVKRVFFYRELQAMGEDNDCHVLVHGMYSDGNFSKVPAYNCKIEFIGDSISSGEGTYGAHEDMDWIPMYMSSSHNYINMISKKMNADVRIISQGGWGVCTGWDSNLGHNIPIIYDKVCGLAYGEFNRKIGADKIYDSSKWQADAVVINLGTNDASGLSGSRLSEEDIENAIFYFLQKVRKYYPKAEILWVYGMLGYGISTNISRAVTRYIDETGDKKVMYLTLPNTLEDEYGSRQHPGLRSHEKAAKIICDYLETAIGQN